MSFWDEGNYVTTQSCVKWWWEAYRYSLYSMFFHICKILWRRILKSSRDNWLLKKFPGRYERCILRCVTPWTFWQKSEPLDIGRNVDQKQQKKLLFWVFGWTFLFKLLLFLNELSYRYQIGLKLKLIYCIF